MNTLTFDKLRYIKKLEVSGIAQAKAQADALDDALRDSVTTRYDTELLRSEMQTSIIASEHRITVRIGAMIIAASAFLTAIKFFA